ncbi:MAG: glutathione S-transferase [Alphaproteobacteria bacterium RIFCSPHIGHO2_12_FULL_63_12]|nr:MAG: glutathione S-transferase [Alphaproteobacteria bacterium RIFCSPHIGHO2_12_FULL_63_12]
MNAEPVYKLLTEEDWLAAEVSGVTATALDLADGYVHLSTGSQVRETARRHYSGHPRVRLLRFRLDGLGDVRWETSRGGDLFPHLYGPLEITRAEAAIWLKPGPDGAPLIPGDF